MASKWLDPQEHDGTATPDNFLIALHDALIKNFRETLYDHLAWPSATNLPRTPRARRSGCGPGSSSTTASRSPPRTCKWSYETLSRRLAACAARRRPSASRSSMTARSAFTSRSRSSISRMLFGTGNVSGAGWVVPAKYYQQVGPDGFKQKPIGAGPYKLVLAGAGHQAGVRSVRGLLPAGARQAARDDRRAGGGDARRHAGARRGGHRSMASPAS